MAEQEGVIKFQLDFKQVPLPAQVDLTELVHWRKVLFELGLVGQDDSRYAGLGFGNISQRWPDHASSFLVTGSQTGHLPVLEAGHYAWVTAWDVRRNYLQAHGCTQPSSESLSHALLYEIDPHVGAVVHVHSPHIWNNAGRLGLPGTPAQVPYGTPELAESIRALYRQGALGENPLFVMHGHEDGVIAFGASLELAVKVLLGAHERAHRLP